MERADYTRVAHAGMAIMNPIPAEKLDEVLALLDLRRGAAWSISAAARATCSRASRSATRSTRSASTVTRSSSPRRLSAGINVIVADIETWNRGRGAFDLVASVGSPASLSSLAGLVRPGGLVLYGDGYWRGEPSAEFLESLGATREELQDYAGTIRQGTASGCRRSTP